MSPGKHPSLLACAIHCTKNYCAIAQKRCALLRVRGNTSGEGGITDPSRARPGQDNTSSGLLPHYSASLASQTTVSFEDDERSLLGCGRRSRLGGSIADESTVSATSQGAGRKRRPLVGKWRRQNQAGALWPTGGAKASTRAMPSFSSCFPRLSREPPPLAIAAAAAAEDEADLPAGPSVSHGLGQPDTCGANTTQVVAKSSSSSSAILPPNHLRDLPKNEHTFEIEPNDEKSTKNGSKGGERSVITPAGNSQQPSREFSARPKKISEGHMESANRHVDSCAGGVDDSGDAGGGTPWQDHAQLQPAMRPSATRAAATTTWSVIPDDLLLPPSISHTLETFEAPRRRPSIEIDAAFSRSSRLPTAPVPHSTPRFTSVSGSASIGASRGDGSRSGGSVDALASGRILPPGDRTRGIIATLPSENEATIGSSSSFRASTRHGASTGTRGGVREGGEGHHHASPGKTHRKSARGMKNTKQNQNQRKKKQQQRRQSSVPSSSTARSSGARSRAIASAAANTSWTEWTRPGEPKERDTEVDRQANTKAKGGEAWANNGAASGAGWGGNDQVSVCASESLAKSRATGHTCCWWLIAVRYGTEVDYGVL